MVEDYLTDRDQEEALRNWWRENWKWILAGVALGLGLLAAYQYWQTYQSQRAGAAAKVYADFQKALAGNDLEQAGRLLNDLAGDHAKSAYTQQGRLLLAKRDADAGRFDEASKQLRQVVDTSSDEELASIARLRLARLLIQTGKPDEALAVARHRRGRHLCCAHARDPRRRQGCEGRCAGRACGIRRGACRRVQGPGRSRHCSS